MLSSCVKHAFRMRVSPRTRPAQHSYNSAIANHRAAPRRHTKHGRHRRSSYGGSHAIFTSRTSGFCSRARRRVQRLFDGRAIADPIADAGRSSTAVTIPKNAEFLANQAFMPDEVTVNAGTTVVWTNTDSTSHTSTADGNAWNSGIVSPGGRFTVTFQTAGTFPYHCTIHPGMVGTVVVR